VKHFIRVIAHWGLLLHIYVSMAGFTLVLLFAVTGLTLNHQDFGWSAPQIVMSEMTLPADLVDHPSSDAIEKHLREAAGVRSPVKDYHEDPDQIQITFAAPGRRTLVTIDRPSRKAMVESENRGFLGRLDDLHKGFDSGRPWFWIIDITAILLTVSSLTGMITLLSLKHRRRSGFIVGGLGIAMVVAIYFFLIPK
jgi:uncharacterized protein